MKNLRHKIGDTGNTRIIRTVRGVGYIIGDAEQ
jgi:DNA-binding response OmpR family regulator